MNRRDDILAAIAALAAFTIWGLSPLLYKRLTHVPAVEVFAHRLVWSFVLVGLFVAVSGRAGRVREAFADRRELPWLLVTTALISFNWLVFILAVQSGQALEASLGFYVLPLITVALSYLFLGERFHRAQLLAFALAAAAVATLALGLGAAPWISLALSLSFSTYSVIKKRMLTGPISGVMVEITLVAPLALGWLAWVHAGPEGGAFGRDWETSLLLVLSGPATAAPLILFSTAALRLRLSTLGLMQYVNPSLQMLLAVMVFGEMMTVWHAAALTLIWAGLAVYSRDAWVQERAASRAARTAAGESQTVR